MIYSIRGSVELILDDALVVSIHGIISLKVLTPNPSKFPVGSPVLLFTHLAVREDSLALYGFNTEEEIFWFRTFLQVPGIGSKTAINLISTFSVPELQTIILEEQSQLLTKASGVGQATAKKIVLYIHEKIKKKQIVPQKKKCEHEKAYEEAKHILMDLGLSSREALDLLDMPANEEDLPCKDPQTLVKEALKKRNR